MRRSAQVFFLGAWLILHMFPVWASAQITQVPGLEVLPIPAYMKIMASGREIPGESLIQGLEGWTEVYAYTHKVEAVFNPTNGFLTGRKEHNPFSVVKMLDRGTPLLHRAFSNNENLEVEIRLFRPAPEAIPGEHFFTINLHNARIVMISPHQPNQMDLNAALWGNREQVSFVYSSIAWTSISSGTQFSESWFSGRR